MERDPEGPAIFQRFCPLVALATRVSRLAAVPLQADCLARPLLPRWLASVEAAKLDRPFAPDRRSGPARSEAAASPGAPFEGYCGGCCSHGRSMVIVWAHLQSPGGGGQAHRAASPSPACHCSFYRGWPFPVVARRTSPTAVHAAARQTPFLAAGGLCC